MDTTPGNHQNITLFEFNLFVAQFNEISFAFNCGNIVLSQQTAMSISNFIPNKWAIAVYDKFKVELFGLLFILFICLFVFSRNFLIILVSVLHADAN